MGTNGIGSRAEVAYQVRMLRECGAGRTVAQFMAREQQESKAARERQVAALRKMHLRNLHSESER